MAKKKTKDYPLIMVYAKYWKRDLEWTKDQYERAFEDKPKADAVYCTKGRWCYRDSQFWAPEFLKLLNEVAL